MINDAYGIIVEGNDDKAALPEMISKCLSDSISDNMKVIVRLCGNKSDLMKKFSGFLEEFRRVNQGLHVDKALVIRDADSRNPDELLSEMRNKIKDKPYPFEVKFIAIVQELEAWLLADDEAISKVTQSRSGKTVSRVNENLESIVQPKERLKDILSKAKVPYTPEVAREITKETDISKIEYRCQKFKDFRLAVIDC